MWECALSILARGQTAPRSAGVHFPSAAGSAQKAQASSAVRKGLQLDDNEQSELEKYIDLNGSECLNEAQQYRLTNIFKTEDKSKSGCLRSDTDEQLLLNLRFTQPVKLQAFKITAPADGSAPKLVKLFVNRLNMGFDEAQSDPATQEFTLKPSDVTESAAPLQTKLVKFQNINVLTIFIESNQGGNEVTQIDKLQLFGSPQHEASAGTGGMDSGNVKYPTTEEEYNKLKATQDKLVVVDFFAKWCGPCKFIAPVFADMSKRYTNAVFISIDTEKVKVGDAADVRALPTFKFFKNGRLLTQFSGADAAKLEATVKQHV